MDRLYTIYDDLAQTSGPIFQARNLDVAKRYVEKIINDTSIKLSEYTLVDLGSFDVETATIFADVPTHYKLASLFVDDSKEDK